MHDDDFELDFGEDELEFVQPAAVAAAASVVEQQQEQQQDEEEVSAASTSIPFSQPHPSTATSQESPVAATSTVKVTPREASSSSRGSSGAPGAWGRSLPRQQEYPSSNSSRRDGGRAKQGADDLYAPRPSPSSRPSASSTSRAAPATASAPTLPTPTPTPSAAPALAPVVTRQESATPPPPPAPTAIHDETLDAHGRPLPAGWVSRVSKSTNQGYYYRNSVTNTSSWDNPNDAPPAVEEEPSPPPPAPSAPAPALAPVEQQQVAVEQEKPKRLAVHPDRLKLVGASASDSSSTVDSRNQPDGSRVEGSGLGSGVAGTSPSGFKRMSNEGRKALPPQQQAIPVNTRPTGRKGARGSFGAPSANAIDVNRLPLPTGPRADIKHVEAVAAAPAPPPPTGPRDPPAGPRNRIASTGPAGGIGDRWAVQVQGTGPKWAAKGGPGSRLAPTPPQQQPAIGPRAARSVAAAPAAGLEGVPRGPAADVSRSNATAIHANSSSNKEPAPTSNKPPPTGPSKQTINDRWAPRDRASAPPPSAPPAAPTGPRGARQPVDSRALDDSLESYNAARPARSPSLTREVAPPPVQTRPRRTSSPPRAAPPSAPTLVPTLNRDLPPHLRGSAPAPPQQQRQQAQAVPLAPIPSKRRSLSPPLGPSPLQKKRAAEERRAGGRIPGGAGGRGGPAITAANLAPLGPRKAFGGRAQEVEDAPRGRSPVREVVPPAPAPVSVNNWGARAARVPVAVASVREEPVVERRREPEPERRRRSPSPPSRRASQYPEPEPLPSRSSRYRSPSSPPPTQRRRSFSPAPSFRRRSPSPQAQRRRYEASPPHAPPQAAYRDRSPPPHVAARSRPRSRSRSPPPRRPLSPPRPGYSTSSNTSRRRSPSPPLLSHRRRSPSPPRHRYRDERSLSPPPRNGGWGDRAARYPGPMGPRRDPLPSVERWSLREGDLIDARTGRKVVPTSPVAAPPPPAPRGSGAGGGMRDWSTSPPPGNRGSHLRGKFRDDGREVPELRPYVPPKDPTPPPPVRERPRARTPPPPVATLPAGLPANPLKASSSTIRPGNERTNGHPPPPPAPASSTSTAPPPTSSLLSRLSAAPGLPPRPSSTDGAPIHLSIKRAASAQGNREDGVEGKRRR